ncbi:MAG: hypothetical protein ACI9VM_000669 [Candidatus Azotimanducaceae bacterium]|jgi:hypothetical protein
MFLSAVILMSILAFWGGLYPEHFWSSVEGLMWCIQDLVLPEGAVVTSQGNCETAGVRS